MELAVNFVLIGNEDNRFAKKMLVKYYKSVYVFVVRIEKAEVPLAELRVILGKTQPEMAALLGVSLPTIQSIESRRTDAGRMRVSEKLAWRISFETGVDVNWVRRAHRSESHPPIDSNRRPYTKKTFEERRASFEAAPIRKDLLNHIHYRMGHFIAKMASALISANRRGKYQLCRYKLQIAIDEISAEFGNDQDTMNAIILCGPQRLNPVVTQPVADAIKKGLH